MHPVGPLTPKVYWVRRVAAVVLAVVVLIGMVWFLATRSSRSSAVSEAAVNAATTAAAPTLTGELAASTAVSAVPTKSSSSPAASASGSTTGSLAAGSRAAGSATAAPGAATSATVPAAAGPAKPKSAKPPSPKAAATSSAPKPAATTKAPAPRPAPAPPPPSFDAQGRLLCADADITLTATTSAPTFSAGQQPRLLLTVTNTGKQVCQRDVSGTLQVFTVFGADGTRIWSTADCFPGTGTEVRELTPGQQLQYTIKWSGTTSAPGCAGARSAVPAGAYTVIAQLGGLSSPPAAFTITG